MFKEFRKLDIFYHNGISLSNMLKRIHKNPGKQKDLFLGPPDFDGYSGLPDFEGFKVVI